MSRPKQWYARPAAGLRWILAAAALSFLPSAIAAQDTTRVPTVAVLKRVAEAVAGYPDSATVFVVLDSTQEVAGVISSRSLADSIRRRVRGEIHGPFRALPDLSDFLMRCVHDGRSSAMHICNGRIPVIRLVDIRTISLVIGTRDGASHTIELPPQADAIFLTMTAFDRFAVPYYTRLNGVDAAAQMRQRMLAENRRRR